MLGLSSCTHAAAGTRPTTPPPSVHATPPAPSFASDPPDATVQPNGGDGGGGIHHGPGGGTLTVGLTVSMDGSPGLPASSPGLPSPYKVIATPSHDPTSPIAGLCNPGGGINFGWIWEVRVIDTTTGALISDTPLCVALGPGTPPPGPGPIEATPPTIGEIWKQVAIPQPPLELSPPDEGVTGLDTWMWSTSPATITIDAAINGWTVTGVATRTAFVFDAGEGDGAALRTADGGSLAHPALSHVYETKGTYTVEVAAIWTATVTMTGPGIVARRTPIGTAWLTVSGDYPVVEVRSNLTR